MDEQQSYLSITAALPFYCVEPQIYNMNIVLQTVSCKKDRLQLLNAGNLLLISSCFKEFCCIFAIHKI
jgi:hypothetical protein